jgi:SPP1 gp7 family putative phage head morphogenesis protein
MPRLRRTKSERRSLRERWNAARKADKQYAAQLKRIARNIGTIIKGLTPDSGIPENTVEIQTVLGRYAEMLGPWARSVARRMMADVNHRDEKVWQEHSYEIGSEVERQLRHTRMGEMYQQAMERQVALITSLPIEAGQRVHELVLESKIDSTRASEIAKEIMASGEVTASRAKLIARTEVARCASEFTQARAEQLGSTHYVWETAEDGDVRQSHKEMQDKVIPWATPPTLSDGTVTHAGRIYNCRCWPRPILPTL